VKRSFKQALASLARALDRISPASMVIGGVAVIAQGVPRFTLDIDATVEAAIADLPRALRTLRRENIVPRIDGAVDFAARSQVLLLVHHPTGVIDRLVVELEQTLSILDVLGPPGDQLDRLLRILREVSDALDDPARLQHLRRILRRRPKAKRRVVGRRRRKGQPSRR
jgi:hypothetical protein